MTPSFGERTASAVGAATVVGLFGCLLVFGLGVAVPRVRTEPIEVVSLSAPPAPPPPVIPPPARKSKPAPAEKQASSAAPPPRLTVFPTPFPLPLASAPAGVGVAGVGTGSGAGNGSGGGGSGGTADGEDQPPRQIKGDLDYSLLPSAMRAARVEGVVSVRYEVETDGRVGSCTPTGSSGNAELDLRTCQLIQRHFRFDPARDGGGRPVPATIEEEHRWSIEIGDDDDQPAPR